MYLISNSERRDIVRLLRVLKTMLVTDKNSRAANMARIAGLLIRTLEARKTHNTHSASPR